MSKDKRVLGKVGMALLLVFFYAPILFMIDVYKRQPLYLAMYVD